MRIARTDLNLLVILDAIYTQGGVTRAAEVLNLTQPTISHALGRLRERLDDPLFVRHGQKLVPTPVARKIIGPVRSALQTIETTLSDLEGFDPATAGMTFTVGIHPLMEDMVFRPLAGRLRQAAPNVAIASVLLDRRNLEADLASGVLNAAIDVFLPLPDAIHRKRISSGRMIVVARGDHPQVGDHLDLETYLSLGHVLVSARRQGQGPEDFALARAGLSRHIAIRCQQISTGMQLVAASDLVMTMSETYASRANRVYRNRIVAAPFDAPAIDTFLYWHANSDFDHANAWLRNMIEETATTDAGD